MMNLIRSYGLTDVVMPQMGESIAEGTIVRWIKKVGDKVERDEPLFEISTDKVDAEIPSPAAGVVTEIRAKEGETVPVNSVVAVIGAAGCAGPGPPARRLRQPRRNGAAQLRRRRRRTAAQPPRPQHGRSRRLPRPPRTPPQEPAAAGGRRRSSRRPLRQRSSPLVREIAKEHNVDISQIAGHGHRRPCDEGRHPRLHRARRPIGAPAGTAGASGPQRCPSRPQLRRASRRCGWPVRACRCRSCGRRSPSTWSRAGARRRTCTRCSR